jgi:small nuclear ribonucleoprotein (snRNP)-like protein
MKRVLIAVFALALAGATGVVAQERVTVLLKSGERVSGELIGFEDNWLSVRSDNQQRRFGSGDIVAIDFTGTAQNFPEAETQRIGHLGALVVLRNGDNFEGYLKRMGQGGRTLVMDTPAGEREIAVRDMQRYYFARPSDHQAAIDSARRAEEAGRQPDPGRAAGRERTGRIGPRGETVVVPANQPWTATNIMVQEGDLLVFRVSGEIRLSADPTDVARPAGSVTERRAAGAPMPNTLAGALIGRIGDAALGSAGAAAPRQRAQAGQPQVFGIGNQTAPLRMPASGMLYLGINDDRLEDNQGSFRVQIQRGESTQQRRRR